MSVRMETALEAKTLDYHEALYRIREFICIGTCQIRNRDVLAVPTAPITPPRLSDVEDPEEYKPRTSCPLAIPCQVMCWVFALSVITLPAGLDRAGMPVGLQLIARPNREEDLIAGALGIERVLGTSP